MSPSDHVPELNETVTTAPPGGVQSVHRALDLLEIVATRPAGVSMADVALATGIPLPTTHRLMRTLTDRGYLRQLPNRQYALGFRLVPLGKAAHVLMGADADSVLADLVEELGETANLAVLTGDHAEYVAQVPSRFAMRMFTEVGRRVELHCTGVGKALLSQLSDAEVAAIVHRVGLPGYTPHTITTETALRAAISRIRRDGYALDEQEQELGVRCVAVPIAGPGPSFMAVSVSGPVTRMTDAVLERAVPLLRSAADHLVTRLEASPSLDAALRGSDTD